MLAIAALSARSGVELAAAHGRAAVALDVFGDADTRRAARQWLPVGDAASLRIDGTRLLEALRTLARNGSVSGWIAGSGFDEQPGLLAQAAQVLPLHGTAPVEVARLRCPPLFFDRLDALGIDHPPVRHEAPDDVRGWLCKHPASSGGWSVRRAADGTAEEGGYWQREQRGRSLSAAFVADGSDARLLGINEALTESIGARPFVFAGIVGPLPVDAALWSALAQRVSDIARAWHLRGLASLDFVLGDDGRVQVLEVNARLCASAALYAARDPIGLHLDACVDGRLPPADALPPPAAVHGLRTVFAPCELQVDDALAARLAALPRTHDLPLPGGMVPAGAPLCSLSAAGADAAAVRDDLERRSAALRASVEEAFA